jgi:hypothetical protein
VGAKDAEKEKVNENYIIEMGKYITTEEIEEWMNSRSNITNFDSLRTN